MDLIFKSSYHIHFLILMFVFFYIYVKELFGKVFIHVILLWTTFNPPLKQWYHYKLQF
jgi:hypothetical protein